MHLPARQTDPPPPRHRRYLYQCHQPGVHDYLCNKLFDMHENAIDAYLLELVYLAVGKPGGALERTLIELASRSFKIALKVRCCHARMHASNLSTNDTCMRSSSPQSYWLLLALVQDNPKSKHLQTLIERVEIAALDGKWAVPFRNPQLDPLSPSVLSPMFSPTGILSPTQRPPGGMSQVAGAQRGAGGTEVGDGILTLTEIVMGLTPEGAAAAAAAAQPLKIDLDCLPAPEARGMSISIVSASAESAGAAAAPSFDAGSLSASSAAAAAAPQTTSRGGSLPAPGTPEAAVQYSRIRQALGSGEGVTALLERSRAAGGRVVATEDGGVMSQVLSEEEEGPGSPTSAGGCLSPTMRLRRDTFGATLDFIEVGRLSS